MPESAPPKVLGAVRFAPESVVLLEMPVWSELLSALGHPGLFPSDKRPRTQVQALLDPPCALRPEQEGFLLFARPFFGCGCPVAYSVPVGKAPFSGGSPALRLRIDQGQSARQTWQSTRLHSTLPRGS